MQFNRLYLIILIILFLSLLYSYYYFSKNSPNFEKLWGRIPESKKNIYYGSVFITLVAFIVFLYYLSISNSFIADTVSKQITKLFIILVIFLLLSISWTPMSLYYLTNKSTMVKYQIILIMFLIPLSLIYPIYVLYNLRDDKHPLLKNISLAGIVYYFLHTFILDGILWCYYFF
jgi:hypothetical protein